MYLYSSVPATRIRPSVRATAKVLAVLQSSPISWVELGTAASVACAAATVVIASGPQAVSYKSPVQEKTQAVGWALLLGAVGWAVYVAGTALPEYCLFEHCASVDHCRRCPACCCPEPYLSTLSNLTLKQCVPETA